MGSLMEEAMRETWVRKHVKSCISHLHKQTVKNLILPVIKTSLDNHFKEFQFVESIAKEIEKHEALSDIHDCISCIETRLSYLLEDLNMPNVEGFVSFMGCSLIAKFFYLHSKEIGYATV